MFVLNRGKRGLEIIFSLLLSVRFLTHSEWHFPPQSPSPCDSA